LPLMQLIRREKKNSKKLKLPRQLLDLKLNKCRQSLRKRMILHRKSFKL